MNQPLGTAHQRMIAWANTIARYCKQNPDIRTGQYLFNSLPPTTASIVAGSTFDPFHKDLTEDELYEWMDNHLIFSDMSDSIIGVFNNDMILAEVR